ncbi:MAG TPA: hypothetical protein GXX49_04845, partial [Clostridiaceae bacterium]|nr:hypothetical protein [Clostridiaceae bacterium]
MKYLTHTLVYFSSLHNPSEKDRHCPECGSNMHAMGKEIREDVKLIPPKAVIVRHVRHIY